MKLYSTRNTNLKQSTWEALIQPMADDGGLWMFNDFPSVPWHTWIDLPFEDIVYEILGIVFPELNIDKEFIHKAYAKFEHPEIVPSIFCKHQIVELYHGPSAAFKDIALSVLPELSHRALLKSGNQSIPHILTATSGDTGSAALMGFKDAIFPITVFYPQLGISSIQRRQMTTINAQAVHVYGIEGNFDDAQAVVKHLFRNDKEHRYGSANSINIGRLIPQLAYYFKAYGDAIKHKRIKLGDQLSFSIPSGNFGNAFAAYCADRMGLPIKHLIIASNANDVLSEFFTTGRYNRKRDFHHTQSPSMDILVSSNLERLLYLEADDKHVAKYMHELDHDGAYQIDTHLLSRLQNKFKAYRIDENQTSQTIQTVYDQEQVLLDPHTAVAWAAAECYQIECPNQAIAVLATASAYKFPRSVLDALKKEHSEDDFKAMHELSTLTKTPIPKALRSLVDQIEIHTQVLSIAQAKELK
jgi:threonine synthase